MGRQLNIHVVQRMTGDPQRRQHLLAGSFSLAPFFLHMPLPTYRSAKRSGQHQASGQPLP
jgi:hypothetical protein